MNGTVGKWACRHFAPWVAQPRGRVRRGTVWRGHVTMILLSELCTLTVNMQTRDMFCSVDSMEINLSTEERDKRLESVNIFCLIYQET